MTPYSTYKGKSYLKSVILAQANELISKKVETNIHLVLPLGVVFRVASVADSYKVVEELPFKGRFLAQRADGMGPKLHALSTLVERVEELPDTCPPLSEWKRFEYIDGEIIDPEAKTEQPNVCS